ncbi:hypothetical protein D3C78_1747070 [compost metagenome]
MAQVRAIDPQDAGTHDMRAPDQQGDGGEQVQQGQHEEPPVSVPKGQIGDATFFVLVLKL